MKAYYRIVRDNYSGYEVQCRSWSWPFWHQPKINTHRTLESAKKWAIKQAESGNTVEILGWLP